MAIDGRDMRAVTLFKQRAVNRIGQIDPELAASIRNIRLPWYTISDETVTGDEDNPATETTSTDILIYEEIGGSWGISADDFVNELNQIESDVINVRINSPGGAVFDAIAIYNALVTHPATIRVQVDALAASAASIIAMAGDEIVMMVGSQLMIHDALGVEAGNAAAMQEMSAFLDKQSDNIASIYAARPKAESDPKYWRDLMLAETWLFANEAVDLGLADSVYERQMKEAMPKQDPEQPPGPPMPPKKDGQPPEEDPAQTEDEDTEDTFNALMQRAHRLTNRGYKYLGRERSPQPPIVDTRERQSANMLVAFNRVFGGTN